MKEKQRKRTNMYTKIGNIFPLYLYSSAHVYDVVVDTIGSSEHIERNPTTIIFKNETRITKNLNNKPETINLLEKHNTTFKNQFVLEFGEVL